MIFVLTPTVGWALPLVWPIVLSIAGGMGYRLYTSTAEDAPMRGGQLTQDLQQAKIVRLSLDQVIRDIVSDEVGREQVLRFVKGDVVVVFKRDVRGRFAIEVMGSDDKTTRELEAVGMQFAGELIQQFAYNRMAAEMERRGANVVGEEVNENGDIVLKLRRWD